MKSNEIDFKTKSAIKDYQRHFMMIKGSIPQKDITKISVHAPNNRALRQKNQT